MNDSNGKVTSYLTGHKNTDTATIQDLQRLADENPYFPVAQFLLSKKLKAENDSGYLQQVQKTALYFPNPHWLQYQLSKENFSKEDVTPAVQDQPEEFLENSESPLNGATHVITNHFSADELTAASNLAHQTFRESSFEAKQVSKRAPESEEINAGDFSQAAKKEIAENEEEMAGVTHDTDETTERFLDEIEPARENDNGTRPVAPETSRHSNIKVEHNRDEKTEPDEHERMFQNIKAMLDASSEEADADTENATIPIDPYYTIDYFASQGIKLDLDQNPKDQLGQNLKKFTQWLRHMKKLGPEDATEVISRTETEADIQKIADSSNTAREVVTEAMASVLEKQGKKDKAIELYNKLSFLNPHKSAYFADKIKNLKGI